MYNGFPLDDECLKIAKARHVKLYGNPMIENIKMRWYLLCFTLKKGNL